MRLEEFDRIACRVVEQDLFAAVANNNIIAEVRPGLAQRLDFAGKVRDLELNPVPAARLWRTTIRHGLGRSAWA